MASARQRRELQLLTETGSITGFIAQAILQTYDEKLACVSEREARMSHIIVKGIWYLSSDELNLESKRCLQNFSQVYISLAAQEKFRPSSQQEQTQTLASLLPAQIWQHIRSFLVAPPPLLAPEVLVIIPNQYPHAPYRIRFLTQTNHPAISINSGSLAGDDNLLAPNELSTSLVQGLFSPSTTIGEHMALFRPFFDPMSWSTFKSLALPSTCPCLSLCTPCQSVAFNMISIGHRLFVSTIPRFPYVPQCNIFAIHELAVLHYAKVVMQLEGTSMDGVVVDVVHDAKYEILAAVIEDPTDPNGPKCAYNCDGDADILDILSSEPRSCKDIWTVCVVVKDEFEELRTKVNEKRIVLNEDRQDPLHLFTTSKEFCQWIISNEIQSYSYEQIAHSFHL